MNELTKSLSALDAAADELLKGCSAKEIIEDEIEDKKSCSPDGDNLKKGEDTKDDADASSDTDTTDNTADDTLTPSDKEEDTEKSLSDIQDSLTEDFNMDADLAAGIRNSEFQAALVCQLVKALGDIQFDMNKSVDGSNKATTILAKSLQSIISANTSLRAENQKLTRRINSLEKSLNKGFEDILSAIDSISTQPAYDHKSVISVHDRDFKKSVGADSNINLSKSQILDILSNEMYSGSNRVTASDIISFESGAPLRPELKAFVTTKANA